MRQPQQPRRHGRRWRLLALVALALGVIGAAARPTTGAEATAWLIGSNGVPVRPTAIAALLDWDERQGRVRQTIRLGFRVDGAGVRDFGWVMATPAPPTIESTTFDPFDDLVAVATPRDKPLDILLPRPGRQAPPPVAANPRPRGFETTSGRFAARLDTTIVSAADRDTLTAWFQRWGAPASLADSPTVRAYLDANWSLVLTTVIAERGTVIGGVTPALTVTYADQPQFATRLIRLGDQGEQDEARAPELSLYTLADGRTALAAAASQPTAPELPRVAFAGWLEPATVRDLTGATVAEPRFLTRFQLARDPSWLRADLVASRAPANAELGSSRMSALEWAQTVGIAMILPAIWLVDGYVAAGWPGIVFGALTLIAAAAPLLRASMRRWWPLILALIYLGLAMPAARELAARTEVDVAYISVVPAVALVLLATWHTRRATAKFRSR